MLLSSFNYEYAQANQTERARSVYLDRACCFITRAMASPRTRVFPACVLRLECTIPKYLEQGIKIENPTCAQEKITSC